MVPVVKGPDGAVPVLVGLGGDEGLLGGLVQNAAVGRGVVGVRLHAGDVERLSGVQAVAGLEGASGVVAGGPDWADLHAVVDDVTDVRLGAGPVVRDLGGRGAPDGLDGLGGLIRQHLVLDLAEVAGGRLGLSILGEAVLGHGPERGDGQRRGGRFGADGGVENQVDARSQAVCGLLGGCACGRGQRLGVGGEGVVPFQRCGQLGYEVAQSARPRGGVRVEQVAGDPIHRVGLVQCRGGVAQSHLPAVRTLVGVGERGLDGCGHLVGVAGAGGHGVLVQGVSGRHRGGVRREQVGVDGVLRDVGPAVRRFNGDGAVVGEGVDACPRRLRGVGCGQRAEGEQRCDGGQSAQTFLQSFVHIGLTPAGRR